MTIEELFKKSLILRKELLNDTDRFKDSKNLHLNILAQIVAEFFKSPYLPESVGIQPPERLSRAVFKDNCNEVFKKLGVNYLLIPRLQQTLNFPQYQTLIKANIRFFECWLFALH